MRTERDLEKSVSIYGNLPFCKIYIKKGFLDFELDLADTFMFVLWVTIVVGAYNVGHADSLSYQKMIDVNCKGQNFGMGNLTPFNWNFTIPNTTRTAGTAPSVTYEIVSPTYVPAPVNT